MAQGFIRPIGQTAQTASVVNAIVISGNTLGATASVSSGTLSLAGGNNVTLSQASNGITISGPDTHAMQTGVSGIGASDTVFTSGTVYVSGSANVTLGTSVDGASQWIRVSVAAQSAQPCVQSLNGSTGQIILTAGNNVTLSQSQSTVTISAANQSVQPGITGVAASASTVSTGLVQFSNSHGISFGLGGSTITASHNALTSQSAQTQNVVVPAASNSTITSGTAIFSGSNNVTISYNGQTILVSGANTHAMQTGISGIAGSGASTASSGTVQFANGNNVSFGLAGNTITASASFAQSTQPAVVSLNGSSGIMSVSGGEYISVSNNASTITIRNMHSTATTVYPVGSANSTGSQSSYYALADHRHAGIPGAGVSGGNTLNTSGSFVGSLMLAGGNNVTLSAVTAAGGQTITISGPNTHAQQTGISGIAGSNASTATAGTVQFANSNNLTFGLNGNTITASASFAQSTQPAVGSLNASSGTISISASQNLSVSNTQSTISIYGPASVMYGISVGGNTGTTGSSAVYNSGFVLAGGNNVTLSQSNNSISVHAAAGGGGGIALAGSNATYTSGTVLLTGSGIVTVGSSGAGQTLIISANAVQSLNGTSNAAMSVSAGNLISISNNASTINVINVLSSSATGLDVTTATAAGTLSSRYALADHAHRGVRAYQVSGIASTFHGDIMMSAGSLLALSTGGNSTAGTVAFHNLLSTATTIRPVGTANSTGRHLPATDQGGRVTQLVRIDALGDGYGEGTGLSILTDGYWSGVPIQSTEPPKRFRCGLVEHAEYLSALNPNPVAECGACDNQITEHLAAPDVEFDEGVNKHEVAEARAEEET